MDNQQYTLLLALVLSLTVPCLLIFGAFLFFAPSLVFARSSDKHLGSETQLGRIRALLMALETDNFGSPDYLPNANFMALEVKNEYLTTKLLLAKFKIRILDFERQLSCDLDRLRNAPTVSHGVTNPTSGDQQDLPVIETPRKDTPDITGDLLNLDDESNGWSEDTLNSKVNRSRSDEAKPSSSNLSSTGKSSSAPIQARYADDTGEEEISDPEPFAKTGETADHTFGQSSQYKRHGCFNSRDVSVALSTTMDTLDPQRQKDLATRREAVTKIRTVCLPSRSSLSTTVLRDSQSSSPHGRALHYSKRASNGTNLPTDDRPTPDQLGLHFSRWAIPSNAGNDLESLLKESTITTPSPLAPQAVPAAPRAREQYCPPYEYKYPVQHVPPPGASKDDVLCTVTISSLPAEVNLKTVVDKVKGGLVVSCHLLNTASITGANTAVVMFFQGQSAKKYVEFANSHIDEIFDVQAANRPKITISLIPSSTAIPHEILWGITRECQTRHLVIKGVPESMTLDMIRSKLEPAEYKTERNGILSMWRVPDAGGCRASYVDIQDGTDYVHILFSSIRSGRQALFKMTADDTTILGRCRYWCGRDPCDAPVDQLMSRSGEAAQIV